MVGLMGNTISYRICKNGAGFYKIQKLRPAFKLFKIKLIKEKWVNINHCNIVKYTSNNTFLSKDLRTVYKALDVLKEKEGEKNNNWECENKIL